MEREGGVGVMELTYGTIYGEDRTVQMIGQCIEDALLCV